MGKPLSMDLRERVVGAISGGMSRRAAAARFGVSAASAVRWAALQRDRGNAAARPQGGDTRSVRTEAKAARIWALYEASPNINLAELRTALATEGIVVAVSTLWRFLPVTAIRAKKDQPCTGAEPPRRPERALGMVRGPD